MIQDLIKLAIPVATLLDRKNERKYLEQVLELKRKIDYEENSNSPDDLKLYFHECELRNLTDIFASELSSQIDRQKT